MHRLLDVATFLFVVLVVCVMAVYMAGWKLYLSVACVLAFYISSYADNDDTGPS